MTAAHVDSGSLTIMSEADLAAMRAEEGVSVILRQGCHWRPAYPGFYQPIDILARMSAADVTPPSRLCWGFRAVLGEVDAHLANASLPVHLMLDAQRFDAGRLSRNRRSDLRRARRLVDFRRLESPDLLLEQGHEVFTSAVQRLNYRRLLSGREYRRRVERRARHGRRMFIAGLIDGRLRGYLDSYVSNGVLHTDEIFVASDALRSGIGTGLYVETILAALHSSKIRQVCNGLHRPEDPNLCRYKEGLGFRVVHLPSRAVIPAPIRTYLKARRPAAYYRLTGDREGLAAAGLLAPASLDNEFVA